jgi:hypothetical protein
MNNKGIYKDNKMTGPLGMYGIANSQVQTPGYAGLLDPLTGEPMQGGGGGGGFSMGMGGEYRGRIGADTSNLPPSQRGLYENSAPSEESIQGAYDANFKNGMTHEEIMTLFNNQADNDKKFWADGFAKDPDFSNNLQRKSLAMMGTDRSQAAIAFQQKNADALKASRGAFTTPTLGPTAGSWTAPMAKAVKSVSPGGGNSRRSYTAPKAKSSMGSGSSWKRSYSGGF